MESSVITIAGLGLTGLCLALIVRQWNREMALLISAMTSIFLVIYSLNQIRSIFEFLSTYFQSITGGGFYFTILVKVLITAYVTDFTAQLCRDAGENSIAGKVELAGKIVVFLIASPVMLSVLELISKLIGG